MKKLFTRHIPYYLSFVPCLLFFIQVSCAQPLQYKQKFTLQDTLRGSITPERAWWDVQRYDVTITPDYLSRSITGKSTIQYKVVQDIHTDYIQIDLQQPLKADTIYYDDKLYINYPAKPYFNKGNVWFIPLPKSSKNSIHSLTICYHGVPRVARTPPWDGGWIWTKDKQGHPWMSVACQGLGASVWFPCKDHQSDEPDKGASLTINVPDDLTGVANGVLKSKTSSNGITAYTWEVKNPINNYSLIPSIGKYVNWSEVYHGEKGPLTCSYWVLEDDAAKAKKQFQQVPLMLKAFEYWFGPYPFYEDGYKLIEAPYLGMEHQSGVAYGNHFLNGYLGRDLSGSGWGLKWDYIIVHESGHEWFGNNITTKDIADMWVHEGFTDYSETLFTEYYYGKEAADEYVQGLRKSIENDRTIIGTYGVNQEGSTDMYYKGANLIHTIRQVINNDEKFRNILRGLNSTFYHQTVTSKQVEDFISRQSGIDFSKVFDQYLRTTQIPELELKMENDELAYKWNNCIDGFVMPVKLNNGIWLNPKTNWQRIKTENFSFINLEAEKNFYVQTKRD
jgi:aminopeptidase N